MVRMIAESRRIVRGVFIVEKSFTAIHINVSEHSQRYAGAKHLKIVSRKDAKPLDSLYFFRALATLRDITVLHFSVEYFAGNCIAGHI